MALNAFVRVTLAAASGLPEDGVVNTFSFTDPTGTFADLSADCISALTEFYNEIAPPGLPDATALSGCLASSLSRETGACTFEVYDLGDPISLPLGAPFQIENWTLADLGDDELVAEAALALSFHAPLSGVSEEVGSTRPRARRRGRVFLGPFRESLVTDVDAAGRRRPNAFLLETIRGTANRLMQYAGIDWAVWSRTDGVLREVTGGWVDDAFDTIRSRGPAATQRYVFGSSD